MKILCSPIAAVLRQLYVETKDSFVIISPWIKIDALQDILDRYAKHKVRLRVLTVGRLEHFLGESSDLEAIEWLLQAGVEVSLVDNLHAKVYVADQSQAIVTSANLTHSGLYTNLEFGVLVDEAEKVEHLYQTVDALFLRGRSVDREWLRDMQGRVAAYQASSQKLRQDDLTLCRAGKKLRGPKISSTAALGDWVERVRQWKILKVSPELAQEVVRFFQLAFEHLPERTFQNAWFGLHSHCISLNVGNIWLASFYYKRRIYLLVDDRWHEDAKSTTRYIPLGWVIYPCSWDDLREINQASDIWESYARAAEKIWASPISKLVISKNLRNKQRLSVLLGVEGDR